MPSDETIECDAIPSAASVTATDNCDTDVEVSLVETRVDGGCTDNYTLRREWTATDNCGNISVETQNITVEDTTCLLYTSPSPRD